MPARVKALINNEVLVWARESAGLTLPAAAAKSSVRAEELESWEEGLKLPSIPQLRKLGKAYKRPIAVFYLPEKPIDFQPLKDFRKLPGRLLERSVSPELQFEIRRAQQRRELAAELWRELEASEPPDFSLTTTLSSDPEEVGTSLRETLGVTYEEQVRFRDAYTALAAWRAAFERVGILVFQTTGIDLREARGFSLSEKPFPAVAVNAKDAPYGRVFSMFHEAAHVILNDGGLCDFEDRGNSKTEQVEAFCNRVAAAALLPRDRLLSDPLVAAHPGKHDWSLHELKTLSRRVSVSREASLRRLLTLGRATKCHYERIRGELLKEYAEMEPQGGPVPPSQKALNRCGRLYARLVLSGYHERKISASDVSDFLEVRLKHLGKIEAGVTEGWF